MMKKILSALVCAAVVLSLAGCGNKETSVPTSISNSTESQNTNNPTSSMMESTKSSAEIAPEESEPEEIDEWADIPYASESDFVVEDVDGGVAITKYNGSSKKLNIPEKIDGKDVVGIIGLNFPDLLDINVPKSVRYISRAAFEYDEIKIGDYGAYPYTITTPFLKHKRAENPLVIVGDIVVDGKACHGDVIIPDGVKTISAYTFENTDVSSITIPGSVVKIGTRAFYGTPWLSELKSENSLVIINNTLIGVNPIGLDVVTIPDGVVEIPDFAFENCDEITSVILPDSVIGIGDYAFNGCTNLKNVNIPDGVTSIGDFAFCDCSNLANVTIPDNISWIGEWAFFNCASLKSINIPNGVPRIGDSAFSGCSCLINVTIPNSVIEIGRDAFKDCTSLTNVTYKGETYNYENIDWLYDAVNLGESGMQIENGVLVKVSELRDIPDCVIPDGVTEIGDYVFHRRTNLKSVTISDDVTRIGESAFKDCTNLTSVNIPNGVSVIGKEAFDNCTSLTSITIPDSVTWIGQFAFSNCKSLTDITISGNVSQIDLRAFHDCKSLTSVTINGSISGSTFQSLRQACDNFENDITVIYKGKTYDKQHHQALLDVINGR